VWSVVFLGFHRIASALLARLEADRPDLLKQVLVVDFNPVVLAGLKSRGVLCAYGDLGSPDTLHHLELRPARVMLSTIPDTLLRGTTNLRLLTTFKALAPDAKVLVTAETWQAEQELYATGADAVLVAPRAAAESALGDLLALLEDRPVPSRERGDCSADEVLK
jgi:voltage-gated potassium channel Kch